MKIKETWTDKDFEEMNWHDSRLYQLKFPDDNCDFTLYLDYIFEWIEDEKGYKFLVAPCELVCYNVIDLKLDIIFDKSVGIDINIITRKNIGKTPNGKLNQWRYLVETDKGTIDFTTTGFSMKTISDPILSRNQDYKI
ncbi:hypothetical protein [Sinomicrobium sp. M5D2P9]